MRPPRVLHAFATFEVGGPQVRAARLMNGWGGAVEHVIAAHDGRYDALELLDPELPVTVRKDIPFRDRRALGHTLRDAGADLVCSYGWGAADVVFANAAWGRRPLVHHEEGFANDELSKQRFKRWLFRRVVFPRADAVVVVSRHLERLALKSWGVPAARVAYMPNGVDLDAQAPRPDAIPGFERRAGEFVVGTVARLNEVKNLPLLLEAVALVRREVPVRVVIVGDGPDAAAVRAAAERLGLADALALPGFLPRPQDFLGLFDAFALSSDSEQFPISLAEAMAAGLPCATTDVGDCREMLAVENRRFITPKGDAAALARSLLDLARDPALRLRLGEANRAAAAARLSFSGMACRYATLYGQVSGMAFPAALERRA